MSTKTRKNRRKEHQKKPKTIEKGSDINNSQTNSWISARSGIQIITIISVLLGVYTAWQAGNALGWAEGIFWGVVFGGSIWLVFVLALMFNRWLRRR